MRLTLRFSLILACLILVACTSSTCPEGTISYLTSPYPTEVPGSPQPQVVVLGRQEILFDQVISGPLCNDTWEGTVYVTCDLQIPFWDREGGDEEALFFEDCDLKIAEDAVIYVEAHGNAAYYKGCSCHSDPDSTFE